MSNPASSAGTPVIAASASLPAASSANAGGSTVKSQPTAAKPKAVNVFSNDGSFLERFQRSKKEDDEKKQQDEILARKRAFDERFKRRGKRKNESPPDESEESTAPPVKKSKELSQYEKEVKSYEGRSLKDNGIGVRPLVK